MFREHRVDEGVDEENLGGEDEQADREDVGGELVFVGRVVGGEVDGVEEEGGLSSVDGEGDEVAQEADDVPLVPQVRNESVRGSLLFNAVFYCHLRRIIMDVSCLSW